MTIEGVYKFKEFKNSLKLQLECLRTNKLTYLIICVPTKKHNIQRKCRTKSDLGNGNV